MKVKLISCDAKKPDSRAIIRLLEEIGEGISNYDAQDLTAILLDGDEVEISVSDGNSSSSFRGLRKLEIDYEIVE